MRPGGPGWGPPEPSGDQQVLLMLIAGMAPLVALILMIHPPVGFEQNPRGT